MNSEKGRLVKILLKNGTAIHMYAEDDTIQKVRSHESFVRLKDNGNDNICVSLDAIAGFEVLDERTDIPKEPEEVKAPVPELPKEGE